jgi:hypothetical protein
VHKHNVLTHAGHLWRRTVERVGAEFPDVDVDYLHVDAATIFLVTDPARFDVIVTDNLFGDIVTDLAAAIAGGIGLAASATSTPTGRPEHVRAGPRVRPGHRRQGKADPTATDPVGGDAPGAPGPRQGGPRSSRPSPPTSIDRRARSATRRTARSATRSPPRSRLTAGARLAEPPRIGASRTRGGSPRADTVRTIRP